MQNRLLLLTFIFLGFSFSLKAQDAYQRFLAEKPALIQQLESQHSQSTDIIARKNAQLKLMALGQVHADWDKNAVNPVEIQIANAELYRDFYTKIGEVSTAAKYEAAITSLRKALNEQK